MPALIKGRTTTFSFGLINFDVPAWSSEEHANWQLLDGILTDLGAGTLYTSSGAANVYTITSNSIDAYTAGLFIRFIAHQTNTGPATFEVVSDDEGPLGAKPLYDTNGNPLVGGEIVANGIYAVVYHAGSGGSFRLLPMFANGGLTEFASILSYGTDGAALVTALLTGKVVVVPTSITSLTIPSANIFYVLENFHRVWGLGALDVNIPAGNWPKSGASGLILSIGPLNYNCAIKGAAPLTTTLSSIGTVTEFTDGSGLIYSEVEMVVANGAGFTAGMTLDAWNIGPLAILGGDNIALVRQEPIANEIGTTATYMGTATVTAGASIVSFSYDPLSRNLSDYYTIGQIFHIKGQSRVISGIDNALGQLTITGTWEKSVAATRGHWVTNADADTINTGGVTSTTITGGGACAFLSKVDPNTGVHIVADGQVGRVTNVANDNSLTVAAPGMNLAATTPYSIITRGLRHEGSHVILTVVGNTIKVRNQSKARVPIRNITTGEIACVQTVLHATGGAHGIVPLPGAVLRYIDNICFRGDNSSQGTYGYLGPSNYTQGPFRIDSDATITFGDYVSFIEWGVCMILGVGEKVAGHEITLCGGRARNLYALEGSKANLRFLVNMGSYGGSAGTNGAIQINAGGNIICTEGRNVGNRGMGVNEEINATYYAEIPFDDGNTTYNRVAKQGAVMSAAEGVSFNAGTAAANLPGGGCGLERMLIWGNVTYGVTAQDTKQVGLKESWVAAHGTANVILENAEMRGDNGAFVNSVTGIYTIGYCVVYAPNLYTRENSSYDIRADVGTKFNVSGANGRVQKINSTGPVDGYVGNMPTTITLSGDVLALDTLGIKGGIIRTDSPVSLRMPPQGFTFTTLAQFTGATHDLAITFGENSLFFISASGAVDFTGVVAPTATKGKGMTIKFINTSANVITFKNESASSAAANRFRLGAAGDVALGQYGCIEFAYIDTTNMWYCTSRS